MRSFMSGPIWVIELWVVLPRILGPKSSLSTKALVPHRPQLLSWFLSSLASGPENLTLSHTLLLSNVGNLLYLPQAKAFCWIIQVWHIEIIFRFFLNFNFTCMSVLLPCMYVHHVCN